MHQRLTTIRMRVHLHGAHPTVRQAGVEPKDIHPLLTRQMDMWEAGKVPKLLHETKRCDKRIVSGLSPMTPEQLERTFNRLMMEGKVRSAVRLVTDVVVVAFFPQRAKAHGKNGPLGISVYDVFKKKHPVQKTVDLSAFLECEELSPCGHHRCPYRRSSGPSIW